jgi:hypothetical protein
LLFWHYYVCWLRRTPHSNGLGLIGKRGISSGPVVKFSILELLKKYPSARTGEFRRDRGHRDARSAERSLQAAQPGALHHADVLRLRVANAAEESFVEWQRGLIRADRNPDYWNKGRPYLDRVVMRSIADSATRTAVLERARRTSPAFHQLPGAIKQSLVAADRREEAPPHAGDRRNNDGVSYPAAHEKDRVPPTAFALTS